MLGFVSGYLGGQRALARATRAASEQTGGISATFARDPVAELSEKVDRMSLVVEGLWELLREHGHSEEELERIVGRLAERTNAVTQCPKCRSAVSGPKCQICGSDLGGQTSALPGSH